MTRTRALALRTLLIAAALAGSGCAVGPGYRRPQLALTTHYQTAAPAPAAPAAAQDWWAQFKDPELSRVVERALDENLDIAQAKARVLQSRAAARAEAANLWPRGEANASAANDRQSLLSPIGEIGRHLPGYQRQVGLYDLGVEAAWEPDIFGGLTRRAQGQAALAHASQAELAAVRIGVAAEAADVYLQVRAYQARLGVARRQEATQADLADLLDRRFAQGVASDRERREARAALAGVRAGIPPLEAGLAAALNRLDILMGAQAGTWRADLAAPAAIPEPPTIDTAAGPPALLRRRPDVAAAEQRLIAANAAIGAAIAEYYPKVSISGLLGLESVDAGQIFTGQAAEHQIGAGLRWRLFDFGRVDAEVGEARGLYAERLAAWRAAVLTASGEVESALTDLTQQRSRIGLLEAQITELEASRSQAETAYEGGAISLIEVRDADRDLLAAADQLAQTRAAAARAAVAAYRALGGGWSG
jgi:NodT family efflux transporter outer membrane factor (OMF) lipoprotein